MGLRCSRRGWPGRLSSALVLSLGLSVALPSARASDLAEEADLLFSVGSEHYRQGDFRTALQFFLSSNRLVSNTNVVFSIARCYEQLKQFPEAYRYYYRVLDANPSSEMRRTIEERIKQALPYVAVLEVETVPPGAAVFLDRKDLGQRGTSPLRLGLTAGTRRIIADLEGYESSISPEVELKTGATARVKLELKQIVGTIHLEGEAQGAAVRIDSSTADIACRIPCDVQASVGRHVLYISREGYQTKEMSVEVAAKATTLVKPNLSPYVGTLVVEADERGAIVEIDGVAQGSVHAAFMLPVGPHRVRVSLDGFRPAEQTVDLAANHQSRLVLSLVAAEEVEAVSRSAEYVEDAPASVSIISSRELRGMAYPTLWEAVRGIRGVYLSDDRGYPTVGFRGFSQPGDYGNRVLVLLDGQPMGDNWLWGSFIGYDLRTDLEDIERIEVVRGPGSVLYGAGAFSGVLNLVTRGRDRSPGLELGVSAVDSDMARGRVRATLNFGKDAGLWTSFAGGRGQGRDYFVPEYQDDPATHGWSRDNDKSSVGTWTGRVWWKDFTAQWSFNSQKKFLPTAQFFTRFDAPSWQTDTRGMLEARYEPRLSSAVRMLTRAHLNYTGFNSAFAYLPEEGGMEQQRYDGWWLGAEQRFTVEPSSRIRLSAGGEIQRHFHVHQFVRDENGDVPLDTQTPFSIRAGYIDSNLKVLEDVRISAAARWDHYSTFGSSVNPRFGIIVKPYAAGNLKVLAGKAFRAPSVYELYFAAGGQLENRSLKPENIHSAELEFTHRFAPALTATVSSYVNIVDGLVVQRATDSPDEYLYVNAGSPVETLGAEAEIRKEWKEGWTVAATYSWQTSRYINSTSAGDILHFRKAPGMREVPNAPNYLASLRLAVPVTAETLSANTRLSFEGPRYDRNDIDGPDAEPQQRADPGLIWDIALSGKATARGLRYAIGVYNVFGWRYQVPVSAEFRQRFMRQSGRTVLLSLSATF